MGDNSSDVLVKTNGSVRRPTNPLDSNAIVSVSRKVVLASVYSKVIVSPSICPPIWISYIACPSKTPNDGVDVADSMPRTS